MKKTAVTFGDFNGISPEITIKALNFSDIPEEKIVLITNKNILDFYEKEYNLVLKRKYEIVNVDCKMSDIIPGKETKAAGEFSFRALECACKLANSGEIGAIVTAPVSKNAMHSAGHNFDGQTEVIQNFIAKQGQKAEMLFTCDNFSVLLLTRHIALKDVPVAVKKDIIIEKILRTEEALKKYLKIENPSFAMCSLNPHAGENGLFGDEEIKEIIPAVNFLIASGINVKGPYPADALFAKINENKFDCYVAMYHDQGLIPVKMIERDNCVNTTVGLDVLRTSPAHGTAFDIAGKNIANPKSMIKALQNAVRACI